MLTNRFAALTKKYPKISVDQVKELDPSKNLKFVAWIAEQLHRGHRVEDIRPTLKMFIENTPRLPVDKRDIFRFEDLKTLENMLKDMGSSKRQTKKVTKDAHAVYLGVHDNYKVYRIDQQEAAILYGKNTRWCITQAGTDYFMDYRSNNNLFYFLIRENPTKRMVKSHKYAFVVNKSDATEEIFNAQDDVVSSIKNAKAALKVCRDDAAKIPYTLEHGIKEGTATEEEFLDWWKNVEKPRRLKALNKTE